MPFANREQSEQSDFQSVHRLQSHLCRMTLILSTKGGEGVEEVDEKKFNEAVLHLKTVEVSTVCTMSPDIVESKSLVIFKGVHTAEAHNTSRSNGEQDFLLEVSTSINSTAKWKGSYLESMKESFDGFGDFCLRNRQTQPRVWSQALPLHPYERVHDLPSKLNRQPRATRWKHISQR